MAIQYRTLTCSKRRMSFQRIWALPMLLDARMLDWIVMFAKVTRYSGRVVAETVRENNE